MAKLLARLRAHRKRFARLWLLASWAVILLCIVLVGLDVKPTPLLFLAFLLRPETEEQRLARLRRRENLAWVAVVVAILVSIVLISFFFFEEVERVIEFILPVLRFILPVFWLIPVWLLIAEVRFYRRLPPIRSVAVSRRGEAPP